MQTQEIKGTKTQYVFENLEENTRYRFSIHGRLVRDEEAFESLKSSAVGSTSMRMK